MSSAAVALAQLERRRRQRCLHVAKALYLTFFNPKQDCVFYFSVIAVALLVNRGSDLRMHGIGVVFADVRNKARRIRPMEALHRLHAELLTDIVDMDITALARRVEL